MASEQSLVPIECEEFAPLRSQSVTSRPCVYAEMPDQTQASARLEATIRQNLWEWRYGG